MSSARRACNREQGEWARPAVRRLGLIAAVTAIPGNTWQARNCHGDTLHKGVLGEKDDGKQNRGYVPLFCFVSAGTVDSVVRSTVLWRPLLQAGVSQADVAEWQTR